MGAPLALVAMPAQQTTALSELRVSTALETLAPEAQTLMWKAETAHRSLVAKAAKQTSGTGAVNAMIVLALRFYIHTEVPMAEC